MKRIACPIIAPSTSLLIDISPTIADEQSPAAPVKHRCSICLLEFDTQKLLATHTDVLHPFKTPARNYKDIPGDVHRTTYCDNRYSDSVDDDGYSDEYDSNSNERKLTDTGLPASNKRRKRSAPLINSLLAPSYFDDNKTGAEVMVYHEQLYFTNPVDTVYSLYIQSICNFITANILPHFSIFTTMFECQIDSLAFNLAMDKEQFINSGAWKTVDISFFDEPVRASIIAACEQRAKTQ